MRARRPPPVVRGRPEGGLQVAGLAQDPFERARDAGRSGAGRGASTHRSRTCARRLGIRYKAPGQKGTRFVHTLNGTAVAVTRAILAILENYQQADGSIVVPEALQKWVGKDRIGPR